MKKLLNALSISAAALLGQAEAEISQELFLKGLNHNMAQNLLEVSEPIHSLYNHESGTKISKGKCQTNAGYQVFDLRKFDSLVRTGTNPATGYTKWDDHFRLFEYKICQGDWQLDSKRDMRAETECGDKKANAFLSKKTLKKTDDKTYYECEFTF
mmetsp:Transcript_11081/g.18557  ORF Transcript_11081/g.18557 Transcript_11081/m.18557 type:complete len:155 (-) Transcript_11081:992-1456(-)